MQGEAALDERRIAVSTTVTHHVAPDAKISGHVTANTAYIQFDEYATFSVSLGSLLTPAEKVALANHELQQLVPVGVGRPKLLVAPGHPPEIRPRRRSPPAR